MPTKKELKAIVSGCAPIGESAQHTFTQSTVNNYYFGLYQEGEVFVDTSSNIHQWTVNQGKVYLTVLELEELLKLARGGQ